MPTTFDYIIIALVSINIIMLIISLVLKIKEEKNKNNDDLLNIIKEIEKSKLESNNSIDKMTTIIKEYLNSYSEIQKERVESLERQVADTIKTIDAKTESLRLAVENNLKYMNDNNVQALKEMREVVDEKLSSTLENRLNKSFEVISKSLSDVNKGIGDMQTLAKDVGGLKNVLQNVKTRGIWGEVQLDNLLSQMLTQEQYKKQFKIDANSKEAVDFAILLPGKEDKVYLPLDAKFPIEGYYRVLECAEKGDKESLNVELKNLESTIKNEAKSISSKYIVVPKTTDFAIMYLPLEGLYAEVLRIEGLVELLQRKYRIIVCGPNTLWAILSSLQMGFKTVAIEKKSSEIIKLLLVFKDEFSNFTELLDKTQQKITEASNTIEKANKKTQSISRRLNKVEIEDYITDGGNNES